MQCPLCKQKVIHFLSWAKGSNAFKTTCQSCQTKLKANFIVYLGFIFTFSMAFLALIFILELKNEIKESWLISEIIKSIVPVPLVFLGGFLTWKFGGYKKQ